MSIASGGGDHVDAISRLVTDALAHVEVVKAPLAPLLKSPGYWRVIVNPDQLIVMKTGLPYYFFKLKRQVRAYCASKSITFSETFIDEQITKLLVDTKISSTEPSGIEARVKDWVSNLEKIKQEGYSIILPINRYQFRREVNTEQIEVVKMTDEKIKEALGSFPIPPEGWPTAKQLAEANETSTFAMARTRANDKESAVELATSMVDRFVYAVKLIDVDTTVSSRKNYYNALRLSYLAYSTSGGDLCIGSKHLNAPISTTPSKAFYDKLDKTWARLLDFLFKGSPTELEESIIAALYWYGEVDVSGDPLVSQYLYYSIGMETLLVPHYERSKTKTFGRNAAMILHGCAEHAGVYEEYYKKRNELIHEGPVVIYKEDVDNLRLWLRSILIHFIDNSDKFTDLKSYYNGVHGVDWTPSSSRK